MASSLLNRNKLKRCCGVALVAIALAPTQLAAQHTVEVDDRGILRWSDDGSEVALFGVNYTTPFAYAYRAHGYVGADRKAAIDMDVAHLARLGLDAYRIHVWDREITDRAGNILDNEHLDLLDYLIARLEQRGIHIILTPIFWGGPGYPEPDPATPGFSNDYSKGALTVDTTARRIQRNYFQQFVRHVNPYTGRSYADDPGLIAIELFNEPDHPGSAEEQTRYIDDLAAAVRAAGFRKPIFYNVSQGWSTAHARAVCSAAIQGIMFQWYPTGLVRGGDIRTNMLPNVDRYPIPFEGAPECLDKARLVYEFDAADVMGSYMYPAMVRSFRAAGMQWATQFAYDPAAIAFANTEYPTHYLNLLYTPKKAISLLVAAEAFRRLPRGQSYGPYPRNVRFGDFRVSYEDHLSELNAPEAFYYSNDTRTQPIEAAALRHIAGSGTSPIVDYEGSGAYFLDRLEAGVWRLEVYPDALQLGDVFGRNSIEREVARLVWREWPLRVRLADLGDRFTIVAVDSAHVFNATAVAGAFNVRPGVYVLRRNDSAGEKWRDPAAQIGNRALGEFVVPAPRSGASAVVHRPSVEIPAGVAHVIRAKVVTNELPGRVQLSWRPAGNRAYDTLPMRRLRGDEYAATLPAAQLRAGTLEYRIVVNEVADSLRAVRVASPSDPIVLFDASRDATRVLYPHQWEYVSFSTSFVSASGRGRALRVKVQSLEPQPHEFALRAFLGDENRARLAHAGGFDVVRVRARATGVGADSMMIALVQRDGAAWGAVLALTPQWREITLPLSSFRRTPLALLPRPYPHFLPEQLTMADSSGRLDVSELDGIQIRIGADLYAPAARSREHGVELERIQLERAR